MAQIVCDDLKVTVNCNGNTDPEIGFENNASSSRIAVLEIPPGGRIYDPADNLIYENTGGVVKKANVRIP